MAIDWQPLREIIDANQRFVLSSHVRPDADAVGSELALAGLLEQVGKSVRIINPSALPGNLAFLDSGGRLLKIGDGATKQDVCDTDVHVVLDTSSWVQLACVGKAMQKSTAVKVVIDHHVSGDDLGAIEFTDTQAAATGSLIFDLAEALELPIPPDVAQALYCAIATDTGWFRFSSTTGETMRTAGHLIDLGAKPHLIYQLLYEQYSLSRLKLAGRVLSRVRAECDGRLAYTFVEWSDFVQTDAKPVDTEDLVNECLTIAGTECAFIAVEQQSKRIKISLRSRSTTNVAAVAEQFGGGGHRQAAGAILAGPLADAMTKVVRAMKAALNPC